MILECKRREKSGKEHAKKIRAIKDVPGVVYGNKLENINIQFKENEFFKFIKASKGKPVLTINLDGEEKTVIIKERQEKIWKNIITHVDFQEIHKGEMVNIAIPFIFLNVDVAEKKGGILVRNMHELNVACLVKDIPEKIEIDVANLELHESVRVKDIGLNENIRIIGDIDNTICSITLPRAAVEATEETEETEEVPTTEE
ncbi:MAG: 50S ribosomal protein L25 [Candidatus Muirbacterium halophilum]|nr:50S ribosomal protein L25 [Candidatus Muirbacterium halophilum]MCK9474883.1 50S ribosomal protein L25 [Candidatus Muirbacterium halophilum]